MPSQEPTSDAPTALPRAASSQRQTTYTCSCNVILQSSDDVKEHKARWKQFGHTKQCPHRGCNDTHQRYGNTQRHWESKHLQDALKSKWMCWACGTTYIKKKDWTKHKSRKDCTFNRSKVLCSTQEDLVLSLSPRHDIGSNIRHTHPEEQKSDAPDHSSRSMPEGVTTAPTDCRISVAVVPENSNPATSIQGDWAEEISRINSTRLSQEETSIQDSRSFENSANNSLEAETHDWKFWLSMDNGLGSSFFNIEGLNEVHQAPWQEFVGSYAASLDLRPSSRGTRDELYSPFDRSFGGYNGQPSFFEPRFEPRQSSMGDIDQQLSYRCRKAAPKLVELASSMESSLATTTVESHPVPVESGIKGPVARTGIRRFWKSSLHLHRRQPLAREEATTPRVLEVSERYEDHTLRIKEPRLVRSCIDAVLSSLRRLKMR